MAELLVTGGARIDTRNREGKDAFHYTQDEAMKEHLRALAQKYQSAR
jgi:hypothetical protein